MPQAVSRVVREVGRFTITCGTLSTGRKLIQRGKYDCVHAGLTTAAFVHSRREPETRTVVVLEFNWDPIAEDVFEEIERRKLERPTGEHALEFGAEYLEIFPVVFLLRNPDKHIQALIINHVYGGRVLAWDSFHSAWSQRCKFAGVVPE